MTPEQRAELKAIFAAKDATHLGRSVAELLNENDQQAAEIERLREQVADMRLELSEAQQCGIADDQTITRLRTIIAESSRMLGEVVCTEGIDAGVVMLSSEGTSHNKSIVTPDGQTMIVGVYDHEYFSPLGDALVALANKLKEGTQP
jgi:hypothetical protein